MKSLPKPDFYGLKVQKLSDKVTLSTARLINIVRFFRVPPETFAVNT